MFEEKPQAAEAAAKIPTPTRKTLMFCGQLSAICDRGTGPTTVCWEVILPRGHLIF